MYAFLPFKNGDCDLLGSFSVENARLLGCIVVWLMESRACVEC